MKTDVSRPMPRQDQALDRNSSDHGAKETGEVSIMAEQDIRAVEQEALVQCIASSPHVLQQRALVQRINDSPLLLAQRRQLGYFQASAQGKDPNHADPLPTARSIPATANRNGLPEPLKAGMEALSGMCLEHVKVHRNSSQPAQLEAQAFAQGADIHLAPGQEHHLPHEAWHVVQQAMGRVPARTRLNGMDINADPALEHEADLMGQQALNGQVSTAAITGASTQRATSPSALQGKFVVQMAKPGPIEHAINSCFVAALINAFAVTNSLKNLLNPDINDLGDDGVSNLQYLLGAAVNTVDVAQTVPRHWVRNIMVALADCGIIGNAIDTQDINQVIGSTIAALTPASNAAGQQNNMPVTSGVVVWYPDLPLLETAASSVQVLQQEEGDPLGVVFPNVIHINRGDGNIQQAPQTFNLHSGDGSLVSYRMRAAVNHDSGYEGGHFVSYLDRGNDGAQEWWESDDTARDTRQVQGIDATDRSPREKKASLGKERPPSASAEKSKRPAAGQADAKPKSEKESSGSHDMSVLALTYIYERVGVGAVVRNPLNRVAPLPGNGQKYFDERYLKDLNEYFAEEDGLDSLDSLENLDKYDLGSLDKDQQKKEDSSNASDSAFQLPQVSTSKALHAEMQRQLRMQLDGLNKLSVKDWMINTILNRMKTTQAIVDGYSTKGGRKLAHKIDGLLPEDDELALMVLEAIIERLGELEKEMEEASNPEVAQQVREVIGLANESLRDKAPYLTFLSGGGIRCLEKISRLNLAGGIGRQHGIGDEAWFRKAHALGVGDIETKADHTHAVLHNPDQVAGGPMEILHDPMARERLGAAKAAVERAMGAVKASEAKLKEIGTITVAPRKLTPKGGLGDYFKVDAKQAKAYEPEKEKKMQAGRQDVKSKQATLDEAWQVYRGLIKRHLGSSAVNSALGEAWVKDLDGKGSTRVSKLFDYALSIPRESWPESRMNVAMDVVIDESSGKRERIQKDKTKERKKKEHAKVLQGEKKRKRNSAGRKDIKLKKQKTEQKGLPNISIQESFFRAQRAKMLRDQMLKDKLSVGANEDSLEELEDVEEVDVEEVDVEEVDVEEVEDEEVEDEEVEDEEVEDEEMEDEEEEDEEEEDEEEEDRVV